ncbi:amino acid adenylation domain-containing protein [Affinibrenneria salicis]|nr:amino acid adenylation domain-containing protein [Affinibrenneria salicis]
MINEENTLTDVSYVNDFILQFILPNRFNSSEKAIESVEIQIDEKVNKKLLKITKDNPVLINGLFCAMFTALAHRVANSRMLSFITIINETYSKKIISEVNDSDIKLKEYITYLTSHIYDNDVKYDLKEEPANLIINYQTHTKRNIDASKNVVINITKNNGLFSASINFNTEIFDPYLIFEYGKKCEQLLSDFTCDTNISLQDIRHLTLKEKDFLLNGFNATDKEIKLKSIVQQFKKQVKINRTKIALIDINHNLSYEELDLQSDKIFHMLQDKGLKNDIVIVMMPHSIDLIVTILGIIKSGNTYLPLDPETPDERLRYIIEDSKASCLISNKGLHEVNLSNTNDPLSVVSHSVEKNKNIYIIYTSGSTGKPKGVVIAENELLNYTDWCIDKYINSDDDTFALFTSIGFDLTVTSIFPALLSGCKIKIFDSAEPGRSIANILLDKDVTILKLTPAHLELITKMDISQSKIHTFIVGGEALVSRLARDITDKFNHKVNIINEYGPTETTVGCMNYSYRYDENNYSTIPIGKPIQNCKIYLLDEQLVPVSIGAPGEIYIGGKCLGRGYLYKKDLTDKSYIKSPFEDDQLIYKTGDLARFTNRRELIFLDRKDDQVMIRGYRVELGEIKNQILKINGVKSVAVIKVENKHNVYIYSYIVKENDISIDTISIKKALASNLPGYMIPEEIFFVQEIPLTINGKIDKRKLPISKDKEIITPSGKKVNSIIEKEIILLWQKILNISENIDVNTSFFDAGGHSLKVYELFYNLDKKYKIKIEVSGFYQNPTISFICNQLEKRDVYSRFSDFVYLKPIQFNNSNKNVFIFHASDGDVGIYAKLAGKLSKEYNYIGVNYKYDDNDKSINYLASKYVSEINKFQREGEYNLFGWSFGGLIALEVAKILEEENKKINSLTLIDSSFSHKEDKYHALISLYENHNFDECIKLLPPDYVRFIDGDDDNHYLDKIKELIFLLKLRQNYKFNHTLKCDLMYIYQESNFFMVSALRKITTGTCCCYEIKESHYQQLKNDSSIHFISDKFNVNNGKKGV